MLRFSEAKHGEKYAQLMDAEKESYGQLRDCQWVAEKFDISVRTEKPWSFYERAASLDTDVALDLIEKAKTKRELIESVKAHKQKKKFQEATTDDGRDLPDIRIIHDDVLAGPLKSEFVLNVDWVKY